VAENDYIFQHLETEGDIEQNLEFMRKVFGQNSGVDKLVEKLIQHHPTMTLEDFFVIKHRRKIVASLNLISGKWSIGGILLNVAEMGCVATLAEHRRRGLQRRLVNEFHKQAAEKEFDLCVIEGIPYFYRQFGYEYALPLNEETRIGLDQIPDYESNMLIRSFNNEDIPKAMYLIADSQSKFYVHSIRSEQIWRIQEETGIASADRFEGYTVSKDGEMVAYLRIREKPETKELILMEVADVDQESNKAIIKFLKETGRQRRLETLVAYISYQEPLAKHLVNLGAVQRVPPYAWQIRVLDYVKIFQKMKPLFEKRLATSTSSHLTERLRFDFYRFTVQITVEDGVITGIKQTESSEDRAVCANPQVFTQLLLGYRSWDELEMIYPDFNVRPSHRHLIDVLFPKLPSYIHSAY